MPKSQHCWPLLSAAAAAAACLSGWLWTKRSATYKWWLCGVRHDRWKCLVRKLVYAWQDGYHKHLFMLHLFSL